jgi:LPXTG-motif cell wall-anchored protein
MKKELGHDFAVRKNAPDRIDIASRCVRLGLIASVGTTLALFASDVPRAQQRYSEPPVKVTGVTTTGNVVSISADGSLGRAQTWQDPEGFHIVLVNGQAAAGASANGVRARRVGNSLELVVPVKRGANVTVQPRGNRLDLVVTGGSGNAPLSVENFPVEQRQERAARQESSTTREAAPETERVRTQTAKTESKHHVSSDATAPEPAQTMPQSSTAPTQQQQPKQQQQTQQPPAPVQQSEPAPSGDAGSSSLSAAAGSPAPAQTMGVPVEVINSTVADPASASLGTGNGFALPSFLFSLPSLLALLGIALVGAALFILRRRRNAVEEDEDFDVETDKSEEHADEKSPQPFQHFKGDRRRASITVPFERRTSGQGAEDEASRRLKVLGAENGGGAQSERGSELKTLEATQPAVLFGSYRIDQEVARLVTGRPHGTDVLSSRASDDRRAVEASLLKALRANETDEDGRRRARIALEDYGFVARSCAALLLGSESFERVSAARALGDMKSAQALPFLTEALYDPDPVVRTECVQSLGLLGLPSAIGALLDVASRHQDVAASILGPALTACSVESLEISWDSEAASRTFVGMDDAEEFTGEVRALVPAEKYDELADSTDDDALRVALESLDNPDVESRVNAAQQLAQFQVRRSVEALAASARRDSEPAVRSAAVTSLGLINHESVFAHVIVALSDEAREVRAAAARALSRLSFDRAEAYVRLVESADVRTMRDVAHACIKAGLAGQAVNRLNCEDRRQAYEAFSLLSLCVHGGETHPVLDAVECHRDIDIRMTCIQLLGDCTQPEVIEQLQRIAGNGGVPEKVRRSILETVERVALQPQQVEIG